MATACLPLYTSPTASITTNKLSPKKFTTPFNATARKSYGNSIACKASSSSSITDFDLYDLLGIDSSSQHSQIKTAYRTLQKRCHPDIAGPAGHDMAIILNEVYSILSDPNSRSAYDKEQAKVAELRGYTGKPLYSAWFGPETEERAVFVDEVKCVGCLKCALFAEKTFAIESAYGRARVVAQWADPEHKILEAIETCPVDCISMVERSKLAALEFLMSKQPRGNVRVGTSNAAGACASNIFVEVNKFQSRFQDAMEKTSTQNSKETDLQREATMAAIQAIRSISNWLYWQSPNNANGPTPDSQTSLIHVSRKSAEPNLDKLREAVAARKQARQSTSPSRKIPSNHHLYDEEYWIPSVLALPASTQDNSNNSAAYNTKPSPTKEGKDTEDRDNYRVDKKKKRPMIWEVPAMAAVIASVIIRVQIGSEGATGGVKEHIGGSLALEIVNSSWLPVILAGITWFIIGVAITQVIVEAIQSRQQ
ncbi:chaperone protein dnaJ C76, chloroplastic-like [Corylus avellana]|uniref:chaperone protein dnaJ C76, chloroplastic-like n=1 Tax=Corylus avellana TaxID=13451 RepID=UPI00286A9A83|nr:chaperone protein dnaJ C76, chloroplastic-like [Corylus avellana]